MHKFIISIFTICLLISSPAFSAKAVCSAQNTKTGQIYKTTKGRRSYSVALQQSREQVLSGCAYASKQHARYCRITACYRR